jgi:hypothetical protein
MDIILAARPIESAHCERGLVVRFTALTAR